MQRLAHGYSGRHGFAVRRVQKVTRKRAEKPCHLWLWKTVGVIITLAMISGVAGTFFVGLKIRHSLDDLSKQQQNLAQVEKENRQLNAEKKTIMKKDHIEALAAVRLDLYAPEDGGASRGGMRVSYP